MRQSKCRLAGNLLKLLLLTSIPVLLALVLGSGAILPAFTYLGLLIAWIGIELKTRALAQRSFETSLRFEPFFGIRLQAAEPAEDRHCATRLMYIRNVSNNQAYHVHVGRIRDAKSRTVCLNEKREAFLQRPIPSIAPGEEICLLSLDDSVIQQGPTVEVSYFSQLGELRWILILVFDDCRALAIPEERRKPGVLLNTFEELTDFLRSLRFRWRLRGRWEKVKWYIGRPRLINSLK